MATNSFRLHYLAKAAAGVPRDLVNTFVSAKIHPIRPTVLIYNCTWVCDAKCTMCSNWKWGDRKSDMTLAQLEPVLANPFWGAVENLNISGGEPTTRNDLPEMVEMIAPRPERFILYCDDLSFEADEPGYKALKVVLDGSVAAASENCLIYATSNRRHLMPEFMSENLEAKRVDDEIHPGETVEEKISLSERFGVWVSFYPFDQDEYLEIVAQWLSHFKVARANTEAVRQAALQWALQRGSRSGRVAWQFARDWAGRSRIAR